MPIHADPNEEPHELAVSYSSFKRCCTVQERLQLIEGNIRIQSPDKESKVRKVCMSTGQFGWGIWVGCMGAQTQASTS
eukprot:1141661-Pelagomonas_calceolata.AAC.5